MQKVSPISHENSGPGALGRTDFPQTGTEPQPSTNLLQKLLDIERSVGHADEMTIRTMLMEAESEAVRVQAELLRTLSEMARLRETYERNNYSALSPVDARPERTTEEIRVAPRLRARTA